MKRHRAIDPQKAREAAGGGGWYRGIVPEGKPFPCPKCNTPTLAVSNPGEFCIKCSVEARTKARLSAEDAPGSTIHSEDKEPFPEDLGLGGNSAISGGIGGNSGGNR